MPLITLIRPSDTVVSTFTSFSDCTSILEKSSNAGSMSAVSLRTIASVIVPIRVRLSLNASADFAVCVLMTMPSRSASSSIPLSPACPALSIGMRSAPARPNSATARAVFVAPSSMLANRPATSVMICDALLSEPSAFFTLISRAAKARLASCPAPAAIGNPSNAAEAASLGRAVSIAEADRFAASILPLIETLQYSGITSYRGIAKALNSRGIRTARGGRWQVSNVRNVVGRAGRSA